MEMKISEEDMVLVDEAFNHVTNVLGDLQTIKLCAMLLDEVV